MEPQQNVSFIPKKPLNTGPSKGEGVGILFVVGMLFFVLSLAGAGGAYAMNYVFQNKIAKETADLNKNKQTLGVDNIPAILRFDSRIKEAKGLLANHVAPTALFDLLSKETLQNVQFTGFAYSLNADSASISLTGIADSFSTVALQNDKLADAVKEGKIRDVIFSDVTNNQGKISFNVSMTVLKPVFLYSEAVVRATGDQPQ